MQFYLRFVGENVTLPLAYHYQVQSMLYRMMYMDPVYGTQIHDCGLPNQGRGFKLFCFGPLAGEHHVHRQRKEITFLSEILLEVRTADPRLAVMWQAAMQPGLGLMLCGQPIWLAEVEIHQQVILEDCCRIQTISPILAYQSYESQGKRKTKYFNPLDGEFSTLVNQNFQRKYEALTGVRPGEIQLTATAVGARDKTVTRYRDIWLTGWGGQFELKGAPEALSFLYDAGLGAKNAGGFGMFRVVEEQG
jgi:CRISPR-associated endoribonuclease Cas6